MNSVCFFLFQKWQEATPCLGPAQGVCRDIGRRGLGVQGLSFLCQCLASGHWKVEVWYCLQPGVMCWPRLWLYGTSDLMCLVLRFLQWTCPLLFITGLACESLYQVCAGLPMIQRLKVTGVLPVWQAEHFPLCAFYMIYCGPLVWFRQVLRYRLKLYWV